MDFGDLGDVLRGYKEIKARYLFVRVFMRFTAVIPPLEVPNVPHVYPTAS